jgi:GNAT superfamily N-acetyltransferase
VTATIRIRTPEDYPAIAAVYNSAYPPDTIQTNPADLRHMDEAFGPKYHARRAVLEFNGRIIGVCRSVIPPTIYHPQKFQTQIAVMPEFQRRGFGTMLLHNVLEAIEPYDPLVIRSNCCEDSANSVGFLQHHRFREEHRLWESHLDVRAFDFAPFAGAIERVRKQGIRMVPLSDLTNEDDWEHKLYELILHVQADMPAPEPFVRYTFDEWLKFEFNRPSRKPDAFFIALDGDRFVGVNILMYDPSDAAQLNTDDTGVVRDYRRRGIALALKLHGIAYAKTHGYKKIRTMNESTNRPMLTMNERLGFVKRPAWIAFIRDLTEVPAP